MSVAGLHSIISYLAQSWSYWLDWRLWVGLPLSSKPCRKSNDRVAQTYNLSKKRVRQGDGKCKASWGYQEKLGPCSQANKTKQITFLKFIFRKHLSGRGTSADLEKSSKGHMAGREGTCYGASILQSPRTKPCQHTVWKRRDHILYQDLAVTEAKLIQQYEEKLSIQKCEHQCSAPSTADSLWFIMEPPTVSGAYHSPALSSWERLPRVSCLHGMKHLQLATV